MVAGIIIGVGGIVEAQAIRRFAVFCTIRARPIHYNPGALIIGKRSIIGERNRTVRIIICGEVTRISELLVLVSIRINFVSIIPIANKCPNILVVVCFRCISIRKYRSNAGTCNPSTFIVGLCLAIAVIFLREEQFHSCPLRVCQRRGELEGRVCLGCCGNGVCAATFGHGFRQSRICGRNI